VTPPDWDLQADVHRRLNPLTGEWVLVCPHRSRRPWQGQIEPPAPAATVAYDPSCYLCPGNTRAGGLINPDYDATFAFDNDFAALRPQSHVGQFAVDHLLYARSEAGRCRVICYSPRHDLTLARMPAGGIRQLIDTWASQCTSLEAEPAIRAVTIFENRGAMMGASNPHPHCQVWANETVPDELQKESDRQREYRRQRGSCLLCDYVALELRARERTICSNEHFVAVVPFWAIWPFETLLLPRAHVPSLEALEATRRDAFAQILKELNTRYDALFDVAFPYTMGVHQRPSDGQDPAPWHLHAHFYPPLLRSASVRKFMVGYELLAGAQRDLTPEAAAAALRDASR
jgi:UDPglucose--hexose-1-phosphate uridylyltransferase